MIMMLVGVCQSNQSMVKVNHYLMYVDGYKVILVEMVFDSFFYFLLIFLLSLGAIAVTSTMITIHSLLCWIANIFLVWRFQCSTFLTLIRLIKIHFATHNE
mmetsp:Transcript_14923/g.22355  ORF Transcript_14923/g.22355 Transcript_14923/m.22355 type:complete len:101 (-) Transcript_14923:183-485(-)